MLASCRASESPVTHDDDAKKAAPVRLHVCAAESPLNAAYRYLDAGAWEDALACASKAVVRDRLDPFPEVARAEALAALDRPSEAARAYALALAIEPASLDALLSAADFYLSLEDAVRENVELANAYAERGFALARSARDLEMADSFAHISAITFNDLGKPRLAIERAEWALERHPDVAEFAYERAFALYELCRFREAKAAFTALRHSTNYSGRAHQYLGYIAERDGDANVAAAHLARATELDAKLAPAFSVSRAEFEAQLQRAVAKLPADMRADLAEVDLHVEDLPADSDLEGDGEPLSPGILGLFRGVPLGEPCEARAYQGCRTIILYRRNLERAVRNRAEFDEQIEVSLLHEIGHLRGEDDDALIARGLE